MNKSLFCALVNKYVNHIGYEKFELYFTFAIFSNNTITDLLSTNTENMERYRYKSLSNNKRNNPNPKANIKQKLRQLRESLLANYSTAENSHLALQRNSSIGDSSKSVGQGANIFKLRQKSVGNKIIIKGGEEGSGIDINGLQGVLIQCKEDLINQILNGVKIFHQILQNKVNQLSVKNISKYKIKSEINDIIQKGVLLMQIHSIKVYIYIYIKYRAVTE